MQRAGLLLLLLAVMGVVVGVHVVTRKLAFSVETVQHSVFPGIAAAYVMDRSLLLGAAVAALLTVFLFVILRRASRVDPDAVLAVLITSFIATGVVIVSRSSSYQHDLSVLLFGRMLAVDDEQLIQTAILAIIVITTLVVFHKELILHAFDSTAASALGYRVVLLDIVLNVCIAVTVIAAVRSIGTILLVAFIVTPAAAARLVTGRVFSMTLVAMSITTVFGLLGLVISYELSTGHGVEIPAGATVVVTITTAFIMLSAWRALRKPATA